MHSVRTQYENHPYPPIPVFALPLKNQGEALQFEHGLKMALTQGLKIAYQSHENIRILVAGSGTIEPLVVAQRHFKAHEVVAVDFSEKSLNKLKQRMWVAKLARRKLAPINLVCEDLHHYKDEGFDYILATHVLQHVKDPAKLVKKMSGWLRPGGLLRLVTYPKQSRFWMREVAWYFNECGIDENTSRLKAKCKQAIRKLPKNHPVRLCFETSTEAHHLPSLIDAFFHQLENPLAPLEWKWATRNSNLKLIGEDQHSLSQSQFLDELLPQAKKLNVWEKLQILDDLFELCANPVLWFVKDEKTDSTSKIPLIQSHVTPKKNPDFENRIYTNMAIGLKRTEKILKKIDVSLETLWKILIKEVGTFTIETKKGKNIELKGLSITDYDLNRIVQN